MGRLSAKVVAAIINRRELLPGLQWPAAINFKRFTQLSGSMKGGALLPPCFDSLSVRKLLSQSLIWLRRSIPLSKT